MLVLAVQEVLEGVDLASLIGRPDLLDRLGSGLFGFAGGHHSPLAACCAAGAGLGHLPTPAGCCGLWRWFVGHGDRLLWWFVVVDASGQILWHAGGVEHRAKGISQNVVILLFDYLLGGFSHHILF